MVKNMVGKWTKLELMTQSSGWEVILTWINVTVLEEGNIWSIMQYILESKGNQAWRWVGGFGRGGMGKKIS